MNKYGGTVSNSVIRNNYVSTNGGGVYLGGTPTSATVAVVKNCVIYNNTAGVNGGGIRGDGTASTKGIEIINCTVVNNKTATTGNSNSSVELITNGLIENSIVVSDLYSEIRANALCNYVVSTVYGVAAGSALSPSISNNNISGTVDVTASPNTSFTNLGFKAATTFIGAVGNVGEATYDATNFGLIKTANYTITSGSSVAVTATSSSLTTSYTADSKTVSLAGTVPTTDMMSVARGSSSTIGAYQYDNTAPTVSISSSATSPTSTSPIPVTFTFSENVTGFAVGDVTVGNGTLSAITAVSGKVFTATITPTAGGAVTVDVPANGVKDASGNNNTASSQFSITYELVVTVPVGVSTTAVSAITGTTATSGVSYTSDGGSAITASGVVWSTASTPTISLSTKTIDGSGSISGLANNTSYYVRAYATNAIGTTYGSELSFTTKWTITATASTADGTVSGAGDFANNTTVTLTATATASGKRFLNWTEGVSVVSTNRSYSFTATSNRTLVANFGDVLSTYYVRPSGSTKWGNIGAIANQIIETTDNSNISLPLNSSNLPDGAATYYFAPGTYCTVGFSISSGKLYGGFSGDESTIDLSSRTTSDLDGNGIVEPWEFSNVVIFTAPSAPTSYKYDSGNSTSGTRLLIVSGNNSGNVGEINGITLTDFNYATYAGAITIGQGTGSPAVPSTVGAPTANYEGKMTKCIVRKIQSAVGVVMLNNPASLVDQCLIEDCLGSTSYGAVYFNKYGGTVSNSVIRNNKATTEGGAVYAGNAAATTDLNAIVKNCLIYNNEATTKGGAISSKSISTSYSGIEIVNSTIANNKTGATGNASVELDGTGLIVNSIITGDTKADLFAATNAVTNLNGVVYNSLASGSAALTTTNTVSGQAYTALNFERPTSTAGYLGLTVNQAYTDMRAAKFNITNVSSPAVTTTAGTVGNYSGITAYSSVPTTDITGLPRTGAKTLGAYQATHSVASGVTETISQPTTLAALSVAAGGKLTINNGVAVNIGSLMLESDANGTATLIDSYNTPTVNATVKQYVTSGRNWYVSAPVSNALYSQVSGGDSVVTYNEALKKWEKVTADNLIAGKGYIRTAVAGHGTTGTVDFNGLVNSGNIAVTLSRTESGSSRGFNLVGNPYPSYLDWSSVIGDGSNSGIGKSFWYRTKNTDGAYVFTTHNGTSGETIGGTTANTTITGSIPPMQAFWVRVNENVEKTTHNATLTFKNTMRAHRDDSGNKLKAPRMNDRKRLRLQLANGSSADEALVYFDNNALNTSDNYDSPKMLNNSSVMPDIYTKSGADRLGINGLNEVSDNLEIPLGFNLNSAATLTIKALENSNFDADTKIYLLDKVVNVQTELQPETAYSFTTTSAAINNESRFSLIFRTQSVTTANNAITKINAQVYVNAANQISIITPEKCNYIICSALGQKVSGGITTTDRTIVANIRQAGIYLVKLTENGNELTTRVVIK